MFSFLRLRRCRLIPTWRHSTGQRSYTEARKMRNAGMEIRGAWDIGSGTTKLVVVKVNTEDGTIEEELLSLEAEILLGLGMVQNQNGELPEELCEKLHTTAKTFSEQAKNAGAQKFAGVATAVFRKAKNGMKTLEKLNEEYPINVRLVAQETEGQLGLLTASAVSKLPTRNLVSWDSGGGSFQIVGNTGNEFQYVNGPIGDSQAMGMLYEKVRKRKLSNLTTPNPVTKEEALELVKFIEEAIPEPPEWLRKRLNDNTKVITFGGTTSCFRLLTLILRKSLGISQEDILNAIELSADKTPEELSVYPQEELVFPKLCLMLATARKYDIKEIDFHWANGSTLGVALHDEFWK